MDDLKRKIVENLTRMDKEKTMLQYHVTALKLDGKMEFVSKDIETSEGARNEGNKFFLGKNHDTRIHFRILHLYNQSVAFAPKDSEQLAAAYGNRSALLRHIRKYSESISEADKALKITKSNPLRVKLLCRKADCYTALGSSENQTCLQKARLLFSKAHELEKDMKSMSDLITKTELIILADKQDKPQESQKRMQAIKMIADIEKNNIWESVKMEYSEKYGRYLVAARDFEPGDIIFVEKPYFNHLNDLLWWVYCSHCFHYLWTVVPCDGCAWRVFCSEKCRDEAMNEYHDMECSVIMQMKNSGLLEEYHFVPFLMGVFLKAFKEAGGFTQLRLELQSIDECEDECKKGLSPEGKFEDYRSIYSQSMRPYKRKDFEWYGKNATMALLGLAKYSKIFGRSYNFTEIKKLIKKDDAMFAGALIFKFGMVIYSRLTNIKLNSPSGSLSDFKDTSITENSQVSSSLKSLGFLNIFGCAPNARNCPTNGNKHMMYALHPIEKGTPLITSMCSIYSFVPKSQRQAIYKDFYHRPCECQACQENWLDGQTDMDRNLVNYALQKISQPTIVNKIEREFEEIRKIMDERYYEPNHPDIKLLLRTRDLVKTSWKYFPMPSMSTHKAIRLLTACQESFFSPMTWDPEMTSSCSK